MTVTLDKNVEAFAATPRQLFVNGQWTDAASGKTFETPNPATGETLARIAEGDAEDINRAVRAARSAFDDGPWSKMTPSERGRLIWKIGDLIYEHLDELAQLESLDNGKPYAVAKVADVSLSADMFQYMAGWATKIEGNTINISVPYMPGANFHSYTLREPVGVVGQIIPWNFPLLMAAWKLAPALATGCTVVLKPAEQTSLTALRLAELIAEAGIPDGVVNVVTGFGETAGAALAAHPDVDKVAFTGSTEVGKLIVHAAAGNLKKVSLELGGKSPNIVFEDAEDAAVAGSANAIFFNQGQNAVAGSRLFVHQNRFDDVVGGVAEIAKSIKLGAGLEASTQMGPMVSEEQFNRVNSYLESGKAEGATALAGGGTFGDRGFFIEPTVLINTHGDMKVVREEIFGPVVVAEPFSDLDDLAAKANDTPYGLGAGIWTRDISKAHALAKKLRAGSVYINCYNVFDAALPFGGYKQSGWGREMGHEVLHAYTEVKAVTTYLATSSRGGGVTQPEHALPDEPEAGAGEGGGADPGSSPADIDRLAEDGRRGREVPTAGSPSGPRSTEPSRETAAPEPPQLFWNTRFPDNEAILRNQPHLVVARSEYLLETALGPEPVPGAKTNRQDAAGLLNKEICYRLEAENGQFRSLDSTEWDIKAVSAPMTCTEAGTDAFRVLYRASQAGQAIITAFLIVDNGSVDEQQIELRVVSDDTAIEATRRTRANISPGRPAGRSVKNALRPNYGFTIRRWFADLSHENNLLYDVRLPYELADQLNRLATDLYRELGQVSLTCPLHGDPDRPLRLSNSNEAKLRLAKAGAELHHRLFREPIVPIEASVLEEMGAIADCLGGQGSVTHPGLLQIRASEYPLPWGLLYDRSRDGGRDLQTADDVDPAGFWGRRFDIYRSVRSVDREARRGGRRWVKPVIGADVPRNQEQRDFVNGLRSNAGDALLNVDVTCSTVDDLMDWAKSGQDSDLVYLFCHARPAQAQQTGTPTSWLGFGGSESDDRDELRAGLDQLENWWNKQRPSNPIVIFNACSSGQQDLIHGAPFVDFFMKKWRAQAFIGTDWPINASFADMFGRRMLCEILQRRRSLRDAFRTVSDEAAADSNYFPLMYAVYGLNTIQFVDPVEAG